jgi:TetR/AcrR family transcriptional regulator
VQYSPRVRTGSIPLIEAALRQFAAVGFEGASLQRIADDAGLSKSSVLYHYGSKEALLDAAIRPAVDALRVLLDQLAEVTDDASQRTFFSRFVDYLHEHRLAVAVLINHGKALTGNAVIDEADAMVRDLSERLTPAGSDDHDAIRFGVALAGVAFVLVASDRWGLKQLPDDDLRDALTEVLAELVLGKPSITA